MLATSAGVEPATSWSPVRRRIQLSHRGPLLSYTMLLHILLISGVPMIRWYRLAACWKLPIPIIDWTFSKSIIGKLIDAACFQLTTWGKTNSYLLMYSETIVEYSRKCFHSVWGHCHWLHNSLTIKICDNKPPLLIYNLRSRRWGRASFFYWLVCSYDMSFRFTKPADWFTVDLMKQNHSVQQMGGNNV